MISASRIGSSLCGVISRRSRHHNAVCPGRPSSVTRSTQRFSSSQKMTHEEREEAVNRANKAMKGYVETRILAKQGKLKSKGRGTPEQEKSATAIQLSLLVSLGLAFIISPILGRKIAQDEDFREKYVPDWYDFRVKPPKSAWTREELHHQIVEVEKDMRERAIRGDFTPEKLEELRRSLQPRSDLSQEDVDMAKKYGWGTIHPGIDPDDDDDDDDE
ncbi:hypothetical protein IV203_005722 [Nitzschia inconspicua]|uniref:Uncharacterized protein n=1 Tax=Nitzschia inconspicua TaxID=303405 RepID=A0A9K3KPD4_9STRA|nr:hypothetical protein IV203_005722 [Nitzschia inconspicua]